MEVAHDKVVDIIENEEGLVQEEEWLLGVMRNFNKVARRARKTLSVEVGKTSVIPRASNALMDTHTQVDKVNSVLNKSDDYSDVPVHVNNNNETVNGVVPNVDNHKEDVPSGNCELVSDANVDVECSDINKLSSVPGFLTATRESSLISMVQAMALPKAQVKKFDGDSLFYHSLTASFNNSISCILDPSVKLNVLRSLCCSRALEARVLCVKATT